MKEYILAIDQGTTSSRCILFDKSAHIVRQHNIEFPQIYPQPGWVEHNPDDIYHSVMESITRVFEEANTNWSNIDSIGITNQRETTVVWDKKTGKPVHNAIVWQCRRTAERCREIKKSIYSDLIYDKTGLVVDPYFCATKIEYILKSDPQLLQRALNGELAFGTVDSYLIYKLTGGKKHVTDYSNASRTMLFNIHSLEWDKELLDFFGIPAVMLPEVIPNSQNSIMSDPAITGNHELPIAGVIGDQQGALFGQRCFKTGDIKNTYGTGCFLLMNTGYAPRKSKNNLITTIAWHINGKPTYAMEGSVFIAGAVVQWLRDNMEFIENARDSESLALSTDKTNVLFVPAFTGLGSPYWDPDARGALFGITRDTTRAEITKAALQSIAYQTHDLVTAMKNDFGGKIGDFFADGGASANAYLMQFQSDILGMPINSVVMKETTALGAALLAGLATGYFKNIEELIKLTKESVAYTPQITEKDAEELKAKWAKAVKAVQLFGS